jgi:hypothetical protein
MTGRDITAIIITAVVGFICGIYIYWTGFLMNFGAPAVPTQSEANDFSIVSEVYGGCRDECPSFQLLADGSYRYLYTPGINEPQVVRDGSLPRSLRRDLLQAVNEQSLISQSEKIEPSFCNSYTDGIDVRYNITYRGTLYEIDTCGTAISTDSRLWNVLVRIWNYFETGQI